jgi:flagellar motor switch protein FliN/FliY
MSEQPVPVSIPPEAVAALPRRGASSLVTVPRSAPVFRELPTTRPDLNLLRDVELDVRIELGRARMRIEDVLQLCDGAVVELDRQAGDPVDVFVNDQLVARGEVVVLNNNFAVRVTEVVAPLRDEKVC